MKKRMILLLSVTALAAFLLMGCGNSADDTSNSTNTSSAQTSEDTTNNDDTATQDDTATTGDDTATTDDDAATTGDDSAQTNTEPTDDDIAALETKVSDAIAAADAATPSGRRDSDRELFMEHKMALDSLDREVDVYEDSLETQYRNGELSYEDFRTKDVQAEKLEDDLDDAEDRLEDRFNMDD